MTFFSTEKVPKMQKIHILLLFSLIYQKPQAIYTSFLKNKIFAFGRYSSIGLLPLPLLPYLTLLSLNNVERIFINIAASDDFFLE